MSVEHLKREFLPRFFALANKRVEGAASVVAAPNEAVCSELAGAMHALAGEAGLLGLGPVLSAARQVESVAAELAREPNHPSARDQLLHAIAELGSELRRAEHPSPETDRAKATGRTMRNKFRQKFVETATARYHLIAKAVASSGDERFEVARGELHTLGGEASLLAMTAIAALCRDGEVAARAHDSSALTGIVEQLEVAIFAEDIAGTTP